MDDIKPIVQSDLPPAEKVLWVQLYFMAGYNRMTAPMPDLCDALSMNINTMRKHMNRLRKRGAVKVQRRYKTGAERGCMGATYQLVPPDLWL